MDLIYRPKQPDFGPIFPTVARIAWVDPVCYSIFMYLYNKNILEYAEIVVMVILGFLILWVTLLLNHGASGSLTTLRFTVLHSTYMKSLFNSIYKIPPYHTVKNAFLSFFPEKADSVSLIFAQFKIGSINDRLECATRAVIGYNQPLSKIWLWKSIRKII